MEELVKRILAAYGLVDVTLLQAGKGYRNHSFPARLRDGSVVNLMVYKRELGMFERIKRANAVADYAFQHGMPARHSHDKRIIALNSSRGESYAALYDYLPGETIPWEAYTQKHIKQLGKTLSDLHAVLVAYDSHELPAVADEYRAIAKRMQTYFLHAGVQQALRQKLDVSIAAHVFEDFDLLTQACRHLPNQQALHMDFVRSNILFVDGPTISGILDFEKTAYGSPLFDIARTLAFLLVDCKYKPADKVRKYFLKSGYSKRGAADLTVTTVRKGSARIDVLERLIDLFLFYDFYKFLRHNPFEQLPKNEHFIRTRDILLDRKLIQLHMV
jgi:Ser/Thr protein kinase RdoA (MazF antagonist)